ncbi:MAG: major capsid protein V20 domain-containing protein, partial [Candidatus Fonsibacter sp.]
EGRARTNTGVQYVPTTGTILVLNFAKVVQLTQELYAPGSLGSFNLQLQVTGENNQDFTWLSSEHELVIMVMNSGVFANERGTSSTFIGLLTIMTYWTLCSNNPTAATKSAEWSAAASLTTSAPGWAGSRASCQWSEACWSTCRT